VRSALLLWLEQNILSAALSLEEAGRGSFQFTQKISEHLNKNPLQEWEADRWMRGVKLKLLKMEDYFFRAGTGKKSALSLFVRNEQGLNVGLRREAVTQMATFVSLVTDYGFGRKRTYFESRRMDVVVEDLQGETLIYAENKAAEKVLKKLCDKLTTDYITTIPVIPETTDGKRVTDDALMKASHIWSHRPVFFWGISPAYRQAYQINYTHTGFTLSPISDVPNIDSWIETSPRVF
jgi:hypothetical protein